MAKSQDNTPVNTSEQDLQAKCDQLAAENAELKSELEIAVKINSELQQKSESKASPSALPSVEHKGQKIQFMLPQFRLNNVVYTAEEASSNEEVIDKLIELESQIISIS